MGKGFGYLYVQVKLRHCVFSLLRLFRICVVFTSLPSILPPLAEVSPPRGVALFVFEFDMAGIPCNRK